MRCYFDESWQESVTGLRIGVLFGLLLDKAISCNLDNLLYQVRKKYYGKTQAKNRNSELKGNLLLSNQTFQIAARNPNVMPINHCIAMEIISWCILSTDAKVFASIVYGPDPHLKCMDPKHLELPFSDLCVKISQAASEIKPDHEVSLVFDQRLGAQKNIAISIYNFIGGSGLDNLNSHPYFGVSNVDPGIQVADIFAYIVGKRALKDQKFIHWYERIKKLQWSGKISGKKRWGFQRYDAQSDGSFNIRKGW